MNKKYFLRILFFISITTSYAQYTSIPDANFEAALVSLDDIPEDGRIPTGNINSITSLNVANKNISSLSGIEDFDSLKQLTANGNSLTSIEVSNLTDLEELIVYDNQISSIDLSNNLNLIEIDVYNNRLSSLDISQNTSIVNVFADSNSITSLDATENTFLERLDVSNNNLSSLNIKNGNNTGIKSFGATGNVNLSCIVVDDISYAESNFTNIDSGVSFKITSCDHISIPDANFEAALSAYDDIAADGQVPIANIQNLTSLNIANSNISSLSGIEYFTSLTQLIANGNLLTTVDVSDLTALEELILFENQIISIDLSKNVNLIELDFFGNSLASIDLSQNIALQKVFIDNNVLTALDLSNNPALKRLDVKNNNLSSLNIKNGNNTNITGFGATGNTNLKCILVDDVSFAQANFTGIDAGVVFNTVNCDYISIPDSNFESALFDLGYDDVSGDGQVPTDLISGLTSLNLVSKNIADATGIEAFVALEELNIYSNNLTSIDISSNTQLKHLRCQNNQITSLDVTSNTLLETLICDHNPLTSLEVSQNTLLNNINVSSTSIRTIDLSNNTALTVLTAEDMILLSLDVSSNPLLEEVSLINGDFISINLKNGGNTNVVDIYLDGNTSLNCVSVDDVTYATTNWTDIDDSSVFTTDACIINYTLIPDSAFETRLYDLGYDDISGDGQVPTALIQSVTNLDLSSSAISDVTGIKYFTSLEILNVSSNAIINLDLSGNTVIKEIYAEPSNADTINVSNMTALEIVHCNSANSLTTLTLTGATSLKELSIYNTVNLTSLDVSTNTALEKITSYSSSLTNLNTTGAISLKELQLNTSQISSLDLSTNTALEIVNANSSALSSININGATALKELYVYQTLISSLDVSTNTALTKLHCYGSGGLTSLDLSTNTALTDIQCQNTGITSLDVSTNVNLETLYCQNNALTDINLKNGNNTILTDLNITNNSELACVLVDNVVYANTNFTNVDSNVTFTVTDCGYTQIPDAEFEAALAFLDDILGDGQVPSAAIGGLVNLSFRNNELISDFTGIEAFVSLERFSYITSGTITNLDFSNNRNLTSVTIANNNITSINLTQNTLLENISLRGNNLSEIDLSQNVLLTDLTLDNNANLTAIDLSNNTTLINLSVGSCSLSSVDLSKNPLLTYVYIGENDLTSIDVSNNLLLKDLYIYDNPIEGYLDLSNLEDLVEVDFSNCEVTAINLKNGNNENITYFDATNNLNLTCIQVDDATYATTNWTNIDNTTSFSEDCGYAITVAPKVFLQGAKTNPIAGEENWMRDDLRTSDFIPTTSPYTDALTCDASVFLSTGSDAIVDWVWIELRDKNDPTIIIEGRSGLLQRDGDVVAVDGTSSLEFSASSDAYYVMITHRNHLGIRSASTVTLSSTGTTIDFTNDTSLIEGGANAVVDLGSSSFAILAGDYDENGQIQNSDINAVISFLGNSGYSNADLDMNGQIQNSDINNILNPNVGKGEQF
ncbi:hypothetical protein [Aquimarina sp. MMG016]|uniref:hypothetical protein n=1 Tax=Aquimarina sp. MMG016 TaxID=2822690 RepID=UPI001B3A0DAA|nr:hypothetical protein [Aquimarina sp. MMG016]MBQ4820919.1 hypothetical protein [Aquimarina sp. MMG016]